jgi:hypothetical protein
MCPTGYEVCVCGMVGEMVYGTKCEYVKHGFFKNRNPFHIAPCFLESTKYISQVCAFLAIYFYLPMLSSYISPYLYVTSELVTLGQRASPTK